MPKTPRKSASGTHLDEVVNELCNYFLIPERSIPFTQEPVVPLHEGDIVNHCLTGDKVKVIAVTPNKVCHLKG